MYNKQHQYEYLCVFDFDNTLSCTNGIEINSNHVIGNYMDIIGSEDRLSMIKQLLHTLRQKNVVMYILSLNRSSLIKPVLMAMGISEFFKDVIGEEDYCRKEELHLFHKKQNEMHKLMKRNNICSVRSLLIDDNKSNLENCMSSTYEIEYEGVGIHGSDAAIISQFCEPSYRTEAVHLLKSNYKHSHVFS